MGAEAFTVPFGAGMSDSMETRVVTATPTAATMVACSAALSTWTAVRMDLRLVCASASDVEICVSSVARLAAGAD